MWFSRQTSITADFVEVLQKLFGPTSSKREKKVPKSDRTLQSRRALWQVLSSR